jgi:hypothetical protein
MGKDLRDKSSNRRFGKIEQLESRLPLTYSPLFFTTAPDARSTMVNLLDHYSLSSGAQIPVATVSYTNATQLAAPANAIDQSFTTEWKALANTALDPNATMTLTADLGKAYLINQVFSFWRNTNTAPSQYEILGSTDNSTYFPLVNLKATASNVLVDTFTSTSVRYLRLVGHGAPAGREMDFQAIQVFQDVFDVPVTSAEGFNLGAFNPFATVNQFVKQINVSGNWVTSGGILPSLVDASYFSKLSAVTGTTSNAVVTLDYGNVHPVFRVSLEFHSNETWQQGGKIEYSIDNSNWLSLLDQNTALGSISIDRHSNPVDARYIRLTNYYANGTIGTGRLNDVYVFSATSTPPVPMPIASPAMSSAGTFSAAVYDANGNIVRTLWQTQPASVGQVRNLYWDGRDDNLTLLPMDQNYEWRVLNGNVQGVDIGDVGDTGTPIGSQPEGVTEANGNVIAMTIDSSNNLYTASSWEEPHKDIRKLSSTGNQVFEINHPGNTSITTDGTYVYVGRTPAYNAEDRIFRYNASNGAAANYASGTNYLTINAARTAPTPSSGKTALNLSQKRTYEAVRGVAVDSSRLWVSNYFTGKVEVWDKAAGTKITDFAVTNPLGIAVQVDTPTAGTIWIANSGSRVSKWTYTVSAGVYTFTHGTDITGLNDPYALFIGGPNGHLYLTETGAGIREYSISGTPTLSGLGVFGSHAAPGAVSATGFWFSDYSGIAVDSSGNIFVADIGNRRVQKFNSSGSLLESKFSDFQPSPYVRSVPNDTTNYVISGLYEYQADQSLATHSGWMGNGTWKLLNNWAPADGVYGAPMSQRITLDTGGGVMRDYVVYLAYQLGSYGGVAFYDISGVGGQSMRRATMVGEKWLGADGISTGIGGNWVYTDSDGEGVIDWNSSDPNLANGELAFASGGIDIVTANPGMWVDKSGNIWFARVTVSGVGSQLVKLPLLGFDTYKNPIYDWNQKVLVVTSDTSGKGFVQNNLKIADNGDIWATGTTTLGVSTYINSGGRAVAHYSPTGQILSIQTIPGPSLAAIATDPQSNYIYDGHSAGATSWVYMRTTDGLAVAKLSPGALHNYGSGWIDNGMGVAVFQSPTSGTRYVYTEDVYSGMLLLYRIDNITAQTRFDGKFAWTGVQSWAGYSGNPTVTITPSNSNLSIDEEAGNTVTYTATRVGDVSQSLYIYYGTTGTAAPTDVQQSLPGVVVIPANRHSASFSVTAVNDAALESTESLVFSFPTSGSYGSATFGNDGTSYKNNLIRRLIPGLGISTSVTATYTNGAAQHGGYPPALALDGSDTPTRWQTTTASDPDATAKFVFDLGQVYAVNRVRALYGDLSKLPNSYQIRVSTDNVNWTSVASSTISMIDKIDTFTTANARYIEYTAIGTPVIKIVDLCEFFVFQDKNATPAPKTDNGFDLAYLNPGATVDSANLTGTGSNLFDKSMGTGVAGKATATADGKVTIDLGTSYRLFQIGLKFRLSQTWANGGKVEISQDQSTWTTLLDTGASPLVAQNISFPQQIARYIRVTNKFQSGVGTSTGRLDEVEMFALPGALNYSLQGTSTFTTNVIDNDAALSTVTITSLSSFAEEQGQVPTTFRVTRANKGTVGNLTVNYTVAGSATSGTDYTTLSGSVVIPAGSYSTTFNAIPNDDASAESDETIIVNLSSSANYLLGTANSASTSILDDDNAQATITIVAGATTTTEGGGSPATLIVTRRGTGRHGNQPVTYTLGGAATNGVDYSNLTGHAVIPDGELTTTVPISALTDSLSELDESVIATLYAAASPTISTFGNDGTSYKNNLIRRVNPGMGVTTSVTGTFTNGAAQHGGYPLSLAFDGSDTQVRWQSTDVSDPDATAKLVFDLGQVYAINRVRALYGSLPNSYQISVSTDNVNWTTVASSTISIFDKIDTFTSANARYIEYTAIGTPASKIVNLSEFFAYQDKNATPAPTTENGFDLAYLNPSATVDSANLTGAGSFLFDKSSGTGVSGKTYAQGARADGTIVVNLGASYRLDQIGLKFRLSQIWANGGRVEISPDATNWTTILDTGSNAMGAQDILFAPQNAQYIRVINKYLTGVGCGTGRLDELEFFSNSVKFIAGTPNNATVNILQSNNNYAQSETAVFGTKVGTYQDTWQIDSALEILTEQADAGTQKLEQRWTFNINTGSSVTFYADAYHNSALDSFQFQYSTDGVTWTTMLTITDTSSIGLQSFTLPGSLSGQVLVRAIDTNRTGSDLMADSLFINTMFIRSV